MKRKINSKNAINPGHAIVVFIVLFFSCTNRSFGRLPVEKKSRETSFKDHQPGNLREAGRNGFLVNRHKVAFFCDPLLHGTLITDTIPFRFIKIDTNNNIRYLILGTFLISDTGVSFSLQDSLFLNYRRWNVSPENRITYTDNGALINSFSLTNDSATISLNSQRPVAGSPIDINAVNVNIRDLAGLANIDTLLISGLLSAKITLSELDRKITSFTATASIKNALLMQQSVGNIGVTAEMRDANTIHTLLSLSEDGNDISIAGNLLVNNGPIMIDASLDIKRFQLATLSGILKGKATIASGNVNGILSLKGRLLKPEWKGTLNVDTARLTLVKLGSTYTVDNQKVVFDYPAINFDKFTIKDSLNNPLFASGYLCYETLKKYGLNLHLQSKNFTLVNAPKAIDNQVYGYAGANANVALTGTTSNPLIEGDINLNDKTNGTLVLPAKNDDVEAAQSVVRFIDKDTFKLPVLGNLRPVTEAQGNFSKYLNHQLNIQTNQQSALTIILDPSNGDELRVQGNLLLNPGRDSAGKVLLTGTYHLDTGYYELNYQFLKRMFNLLHGSTIQFNGSPTEAQINIRAEYIANTSVKNLLGNEVGSVDPRIAGTFNQKIPFRVVLFLKGTLKRPSINFDIRLPENGDISRQLRATIENKLVQIRTETSGINKQVFALLALDRFVGEQSADFFKGNGGDFSDIAQESVSKFLAAGMDQIASDLFKGINVDLNLNSYKDFTNNDKEQGTDLNVEVSKNFLNDRLTVTTGRNFGIESQDASTKASQQKASRFLPDVTVNYKLSTDGKYMFRSYKKNPLEVILDGYVVETGLAFILTLDYDKLRELLINKNKKKGN